MCTSLNLTPPDGSTPRPASVAVDTANLALDGAETFRSMATSPLSGVEKVRRALATGTVNELIVTVAVPNRDLESMICFVAGDDFDGVALEHGGDYFIIGLDNSVASSGWVELSQDKELGGDGSRVLIELPGKEFTVGVEWRNGDFFEPFTVQEFEQGLKDYEHLY